MFYKSVVDVRAFTSTFTFVPDRWNFAFVVQNATYPSGYTNQQFTAGAGCEGGFYQATNVGPTNNTFALSFSNSDYLQASDSSYTYSNVQLYQQQQIPCNPDEVFPNYWSTTRYSTSPVPLNSPSNASGTTTGDTYSATVSYDGSNFSLCMYDATLAAGSCSSSTSGTGTYYTHTWSNVSIPAYLDSTTGWVGLMSGVGSGPNEPSAVPLYVNSFSYTVNSATASPGSTAPVNGAPATANPTFSPAPGSYAGTQAVTISSTTRNSYSCYVLSASTCAGSVTPIPANDGTCGVGTLYSSPVAVSSSQTLCARSGTNYGGTMPSGLSTGVYTINGGTIPASTPTFSPSAGTYSSAQSVTISDATSGATVYYTTDGSTPTTSSTKYTAPISVGSSESLEAIAVVAGDTNSAVASAAYTITPQVTVATPSFSPGPGTYTSAQSVSISDATPGATINYTTNGSTPTASSTPYTGPIAVSSTETLQAIAVATGDTNSAVSSAIYTITTQAATPAFSPAAGTYSSAQSVSISDATSGATIYYTTNGTTPSTSSTRYTGPIPVSTTQTLEAIAVVTGDTNSAVASATYTITAQAATPTFSPASGTYATAQSVSISDATSGATIYYTTNGTTPSTSSTPYTGPITVSTTETLEAIAAVTGDTNSAVASATYTITAQAATPTFSSAAGTYTTAQTVSISDATSGATIYYTANGTTPTTSSTRYTGPITVTTTETLEAIAVATGSTNSAVASAAYTITAQAATPTFSPAAGTYTTAQSVSISDATSGASIYYTTNGTTPTTSSIPYTAPFTLSSTRTLQAIAVATGATNSAVATAAYTITPTVSTPVFSPAAGTYTTAQSVSISDATSGATIYYTTNGTMPTTSSTAYTGPITVSSTETLEAIAVAAGSTNSAVAPAAYTITAQAATPTFSPAAGTYTTAQSVSISDATSGATIYYTTNGSTPTTSSIPYTAPFTLSSTRTLHAIAVATGATNSAIASAAYTITNAVATPAFSPVAGTYTSAQLVTIADVTSGTSIYYTTNGTTPTTSSTPYTGPITVSTTETLEAIATATGSNNSAVASAAYTISSSSQPTNFAIGTTVQQSPVKHLGINIGGQSYYDSGQISRNLAVRNPGFEAEMWSSILNCQAATATTCTDSDTSNVWPANFLQGATFQVLYGAAKGQTGTITGNTVSNSSGITLTFSSPLSPAPAPGDVVQVRMLVPGNPQAGWWVTASGGATFSPDTTDLSPETPGKQALAINAAASGQSAQVNSYFDSYNGRSFLQLNGAYTLTFRAKAVSGSNQINVSFGRPATTGHGSVSYLDQNVTLTNQWQDYSYYIQRRGRRDLHWDSRIDFFDFRRPDLSG